MGFFNNLKNAVTGGAASVTVQAAPARRGQASSVHVQAIAKADGQVNGVYLLVRAVEEAQVNDTDYADGRTRNETVHGRKVSWETKIAIAGAQPIKAGQTYDFEGMLQIPSNTNPSFRGSMIKHTWEIQAGLDMTGNDPDSGWQTIEVG
jgi:hypothetical protein